MLPRDGLQCACEAAHWHNILTASMGIYSVCARSACAVVKCNNRFVVFSLTYTIVYKCIFCVHQITSGKDTSTVK